MVEPTETESKDAIDEAVEIFRRVYRQALENPEALKGAPYDTPIRRPDEVAAARNPKLRF